MQDKCSASIIIFKDFVFYCKYKFSDFWLNTPKFCPTIYFNSTIYQKQLFEKGVQKKWIIKKNTPYN